MRVVGGDRGQAAALAEQFVEEIEPVAAIGLDRAAVIVDLDRMGAGERAPVADAQLRPGGMRDRDEGARRPRPRRQLRPGLRLARAAKSSGRPAARICQSSPTSVAMACSSAPINVVKSLERKARVSVIGQSNRPTKWSESCRKS